ncbi:hypothetical protein BLNAU_12750 [Blattamonas nauphoetae]|uniref:PHD-type domain-containing protein n=1 Tax=Blattamonas nauphoetae TaxID=2049346 RepID=A0ABQ9XLH9_9EUKA|nr:hypothetical protein BLNAU_12750 [Blattamonas nauphoetae]
MRNDIYVQQDEQEYTIAPHPCQICGDRISDNENPIVACSQCGVITHQRCYGIDTEDLEDSEYVCRPCRAKVLTPQCTCCLKHGGGPMIPVKDSHPTRWAHVICVRPFSEADIPPEKSWVSLARCTERQKRNWTCAVCKRNDGICAECFAPICKRQFHGYCGLEYNQELLHQTSNEPQFGYFFGELDASDGLVCWASLCPDHVSAFVKAGVRPVVKAPQYNELLSIPKCREYHEKNNTNGFTDERWGYGQHISKFGTGLYDANYSFSDGAQDESHLSQQGYEGQLSQKEFRGPSETASKHRSMGMKGQSRESSQRDLEGKKGTTAPHSEFMASRRPGLSSHAVAIVTGLHQKWHEGRFAYTTEPTNSRAATELHQHIEHHPDEIAAFKQHISLQTAEPASSIHPHTDTKPKRGRQPKTTMLVDQEESEPIVEDEDIHVEAERDPCFVIEGPHAPTIECAMCVEMYGRALKPSNGSQHMFLYSLPASYSRSLNDTKSKDDIKFVRAVTTLVNPSLEYSYLPGGSDDTAGFISYLLAKRDGLVNDVDDSDDESEVPTDPNGLLTPLLTNKPNSKNKNGQQQPDFLIQKPALIDSLWTPLPSTFYTTIPSKHVPHGHSLFEDTLILPRSRRELRDHIEEAQREQFGKTGLFDVLRAALELNLAGRLTMKGEGVQILKKGERRKRLGWNEDDVLEALAHAAEQPPSSQESSDSQTTSEEPAMLMDTDEKKEEEGRDDGKDDVITRVHVKPRLVIPPGHLSSMSDSVCNRIIQMVAKLNSLVPEAEVEVNMEQKAAKISGWTGCSSAASAKGTIFLRTEEDHNRGQEFCLDVLAIEGVNIVMEEEMRLASFVNLGEEGVLDGIRSMVCCSVITPSLLNSPDTAPPVFPATPLARLFSKWKRNFRWRQMMQYLHRNNLAFVFMSSPKHFFMAVPISLLSVPDIVKKGLHEMCLVYEMDGSVEHPRLNDPQFPHYVPVSATHNQWLSEEVPLRVASICISPPQHDIIQQTFSSFPNLMVVDAEALHSGGVDLLFVAPKKRLVDEVTWSVQRTRLSTMVQTFLQESEVEAQLREIHSALFPSPDPSPPLLPSLTETELIQKLSICHPKGTIFIDPTLPLSLLDITSLISAAETFNAFRIILYRDTVSNFLFGTDFRSYTFFRALVSKSQVMMWDNQPDASRQIDTTIRKMVALLVAGNRQWKDPLNPNDSKAKKTLDTLFQEVVGLCFKAFYIDQLIPVLHHDTRVPLFIPPVIPSLADIATLLGDVSAYQTNNLSDLASSELHSRILSAAFQMCVQLRCSQLRSFSQTGRIICVRRSCDPVSVPSEVTRINEALNEIGASGQNLSSFELFTPASVPSEGSVPFQTSVLDGFGKGMHHGVLFCTLDEAKSIVAEDEWTNSEQSIVSSFVSSFHIHHVMPLQPKKD